MKSNGCRDVQHTGLQSTQTRRNTGKQGAQTRGTRSAHLPKHPYISGCIIIVGYANQFEVTKIEKKIAWLLDMQWSHWCRDAWEDVPIECPLFVHLAYQCSFLFVCFVGLYAGHPYIHLISFEIFLLALIAISYNSWSGHWANYFFE